MVIQTSNGLRKLVWQNKYLAKVKFPKPNSSKFEKVVWVKWQFLHKQNTLNIVDMSAKLTEIFNYNNDGEDKI